MAKKSFVEGAVSHVLVIQLESTSTLGPLWSIKNDLNLTHTSPDKYQDHNSKDRFIPIISLLLLSLTGILLIRPRRYTSSFKPKLFQLKASLRETEFNQI